MKEFNFKKAWHDWACIEFDKLGRNTKDMLRFLDEECDHLAQDRDLKIPWPSEQFKSQMGQIPNEELARAARVIHDYGHWRPGSAPPLLKNGCTWKFANLVDQLLAEKMDLVFHGAKVKRGIGLHIHEGMFRISLSTDNLWLWEEIPIETTINNRAVIMGMANAANVPHPWKSQHEFEKTYKTIIEYVTRVIPFDQVFEDRRKMIDSCMEEKR